MLLLVLANFFAWQEVWDLDRELEVVFFDVGQGDSIFIETPAGHQILIDGGPNGGVILEKLGNEMPFWDRTLDMVVLTHPDSDHLRGLLDVLDSYKVENILWTGVLKETKTFGYWLEKLEAEQANIIIAQKGQIIKAGKSQLYVFHPFENIEGQSVDKGSNESSIIAKLVFGENSFLFTGDISKKQMDQLLVLSSLSVGPGADVLKIPHHGSKTANNSAFFQVIDPKIAVISCGLDNSYGHPDEQVLQNLNGLGITILRTDLQGDIRITADGSNVVIN